MYVVKQNKDGKWAVKEEKNKRASKTFDSKISAIEYATKKAKENHTTFKVEDGKSKNRIIFLIIAIVLLIAIVIFIYLFMSGKIDFKKENTETSIEDVEPSKPDDKPTEVIKEGELEIHFLEFENYYAGDCVYIKAGDVDILIDAGSRESSSATIHNYIKDYCTDGKLEYVIATHAHQDHIAGFVGTSSKPGIFDLYECGTIIDYALKNTSSTISKNYEEKRDKEVSLGAVHFTARECIEGDNGAKAKYQLTDNIYFEVLDQRYYYEKSSDENNYSVCVQFVQGDNRFLFTGDLEKEGEASLVVKNDLKHCRLFKGGHHGSNTSSTEALLEKITPEVVCVCCCAGSSEYTDNVDNMFPTQAFIDRVALYTSQIYVTSLAKYSIAEKDGNEYPKVNGYESMNGNIVVTINASNEIVVKCSNNQTILKDTEWFNSIITLNGTARVMRVWPTYGK